MASACLTTVVYNLSKLSAVFRPAAVVANQTRHASKTAGGATKNRGRGHKHKRGMLVRDGDKVERGDRLCTQLQLRYYPGENVLLGDRCTLTSAVDGEVMITKEILNPYPDSPIYPGVLQGDVIERIFLHVIPPPQHNKFKLVSLV